MEHIITSPCGSSMDAAPKLTMHAKRSPLSLASGRAYATTSSPQSAKDCGPSHVSDVSPVGVRCSCRLGLPEVATIPWDHLEDPVAFNTAHSDAAKGRDGCRVPLPWSAQDMPQPAPWDPEFGTGASFGFSQWLGVEPTFGRNLKLDTAHISVLSLYKGDHVIQQWNC